MIVARVMGSRVDLAGALEENIMMAVRDLFQQKFLVKTLDTAREFEYYGNGAATTRSRAGAETSLAKVHVCSD